MLENRNKRIKYRGLRFKRQLERARLFKRPSRQLPETGWGNFVEKIGLGSRKNRLLLGILLGGLIYLIWVPNFLYVKSFEVSGGNLKHEPEHRENVAAFLNSSRLWPQKNLALLSSGRLKRKLLAEPWVISVKKVQKIWPNRLKIELEERREYALLESQGKKYIFSNDGRNLNSLEASSTPAEILINLKTPEEIKPEQELSAELLSFIGLLQNKIPEICRSTVSSYTIHPLTNPDLEAETAAGYKVIFDTSYDNEENLANLSVLMDKLSPDEKNRLYYVDMRIKNKAFVCFKGTSCTQNQEIKMPVFGSSQNVTSSSSTLISQ